LIIVNPLIWLNACEPSGDTHAALLADALQRLHPGVRLAGMGGSAMESMQVSLLLRMEGLSVMGISEVFGYLPRVLGMWRTIRRELSKQKPVAIVVVDSPDFHFRVVRMASALGIPVFYYISPQVWAWRRRRVLFLKKYVQRILCILPFEKDFYRAHGIAAEYVGHPLADEVLTPEILSIAPRPNRIGILPGSRKTEIERMMPLFAETALRLLQKDPHLEICVFKAPGVSEHLIRQYCPHDLPLLFVEAPERYAHMRSCALLLATSGTATLESALLGVPTIVAYKCSRLSFMVGIRLVSVPAASLANLILRKNILPEFIQHQASSSNLTRTAWQWLTDPQEMLRIRHELAKLPRLLADDAGSGSGLGEASERAAKIILRDAGLLR
jgi:lipid-A-disaccharide synthase